MTTKVTKESLTEKIKRLESRGNAEYSIGMTINEEYQLEAYRMLLELMPDDKHEHDWIEHREINSVKPRYACECGAMNTLGEDDQHAHMVD